MSLPVEVSLKRLATDFLVFCMERNGENRRLARNCKGEKPSSPKKKITANGSFVPITEYSLSNERLTHTQKMHPALGRSPQKQWTANDDRGKIKTTRHKKSGAQIAPPNHAAEICFESNLNWFRLNFPAAKQKELLLLFRSNFLVCDGFRSRFFRGRGLSGFFGHM